MNNYDNVLQAFQYGGGRPGIDYPRPNGEYYYATDTHILVRIKKELCSGEYEPHDRQPQFEKVIPPKETEIELPVKSILEQIMAHEQTVTLHGKEAICDECHGRKEVTWTYEDYDGNEHEKEFDCPICDGYGYLSEKTVSIDELNLSINGMSFNIGQLKTALKSILHLGKETAKIVYLTPNKPMMIEVEPGVEMLIMSNLLEHIIININI